MTVRNVTIAMLANVLMATGCGGVVSSPEGEESNAARGGPSKMPGPAGGGPGGVATSDDPIGTCDAPTRFPVSDDAWLQTAWTPSLPSLPLAQCGTANNPDVAAATVAVWTAPYDGEYFARGWSQDFNAVFTGTPSCGDMAQAGCSMLEPRSLPEPPWDVRAVPGGGFNLHAKAGDVWFFSFQYLDENNARPPEHGIAVANISTVSW